eukprot:5684459-Pyramimonas_sp.AAC.5
MHEHPPRRPQTAHHGRSRAGGAEGLSECKTHWALGGPRTPRGAQRHELFKRWHGRVGGRRCAGAAALSGRDGIGYAISSDILHLLQSQPSAYASSAFFSSSILVYVEDRPHSTPPRPLVLLTFHMLTPCALSYPQFHCISPSTTHNSLHACSEEALGELPATIKQPSGRARTPNMTRGAHKVETTVNEISSKPSFELRHWRSNAQT